MNPYETTPTEDIFPFCSSDHWYDSCSLLCARTGL